MNNQRRIQVRGALSTVESVKNQLDALGAVEHEEDQRESVQQRDQRVAEWSGQITAAANVLNAAWAAEHGLNRQFRLRRARNALDELSTPPRPDLFAPMFHERYDTIVAECTAAIA